MWRERLASRLPPRLRRWRVVRPEEAAIGFAAQRCEKAASEWSRSMFWPAATRRVLACPRDSEQRERRVVRLLRRAGEVLVEPADVTVELDRAFGDAAEGQLGCLERFVESSVVGAQTGAEGGLAGKRLACEAFAELVGGGDDQLEELVVGRGPSFDCSFASDAEHADRLDRPARVLGDREPLSSERLAGGCFGVDRVALAASPARVRMWLVDLEHLDVVAGEEAHKACSVGAGRLDTDPSDLTERKEPTEESCVTGSRRGKRCRAEQPSLLVEGCYVMGVDVSVDPSDDKAIALRHAVHTVPSS